MFPETHTKIGARSCAAKRPRLILIALLLAGSSSANAFAQQIPFDEEHWRLDAGEGATAEFVTFEGEQAVHLAGARATPLDIDFEDGVIEYDLRVFDQWSFQSLLFRVDASSEFGDHEQFYTRPKQTRRGDALQYTPAWNGGVGWQIYHGPGFWGEADLVFDRWMHVRLEIQGERMRVFVNSEEPVLVSRLRREPVSGGMAIQSAFAEAYFANFAVTPGRPLDDVELEIPEPVTDPNLIVDWEVAGPVHEAELPGWLGEDMLAEMEWTDAQPENTGIINIQRSVQPSADGGDTAFVRTWIPRGEAHALQVRYGYSDRVRVYYNGRLVSGGNSTWHRRDERFLGSVGLHDTVFVDTTERDSNELVFAVSESFGGWGLIAATGDEPED
jgi:hypothetical protein